MNSKSEDSHDMNLSSKSTIKGKIAVFFIILAGTIPLGWSQRIGKYLGRLMVLMNTREVKIARRNISLCFPEFTEKEAQLFLQRTFEHGGMQLFEIAFLWTSHPKASVAFIKEIEGEEVLKEAMQGSKGLVIILPHLGNWEVINAYLCEKMEIRAMYSPGKLPEVDYLMHRGRSKTGLKLSPANPRGISSIIQTLKNGGNLAILPDQEPMKDSGIFAPFFGIETYTMTMISKMIMKSEANSLLAYVKRRGAGDGFDIKFMKTPQEINSHDLGTSVKALNKIVEEAIRENPEQYMWGYKRFRKRPDGEEKLYDNLS